MAQKVQIILYDDFDTSVEAAENVLFGLDGIGYEIDLSAENAAKLRDALAPFIAHGRKVTGPRAGRGARRRGAAAGNAPDMRAWARAQGMKVSDRGRVPAEVKAAYEAAHS